MINRNYSILIAIFISLLNACSNPEPSFSKYDPSIQKNYNAKDLLQLHNRARREGGKCGNKKIRASSSLRWNTQLTKAAHSHSSDMANNGFFVHISSNGKNTKQRVNSSGYKWQKYAENLAHRQPTPEIVFNAWLAKKEHCRNILDRDFTEMGAAVVNGYWTVVFGKPTN